MSHSHSTHKICPLGEECPWYQKVTELETLVITDPLTGLFNLRHFEQMLEQELERTQRTQLPTSLIMIDLDFFKKINDTFGHEVGNLVLQKSAHAIQKNTRTLDIQCRYGGEEFAVICPSTDLLMARQMANRVHQSIADLHFEVQGQTLKVTASLGIATQQSHQATTVSQFIQRADEQLYLAKEQGRNQVCYSTTKMPTSQVESDERAAIADLFKGAQ